MRTRAGGHLRGRVWVAFISQVAVVDRPATGHMSRDSATLPPLRSPPLSSSVHLACPSWLRFPGPLARHQPPPIGSASRAAIHGPLRCRPAHSCSIFRLPSPVCVCTGAPPPPPSFHPEMRLLFEDPPYFGVFPQGPLRALPQGLVTGGRVGSPAAAPRCGFP